jgi:AcrR family transcriptional regulator
MNNSFHNTENEILDAAEKLFLKKGFALTSTTEIAKEAGCNQAMVHYYYRTKEKLFTRIYEKKILLFLSDFLHDSRKNMSFEERIRGMIEAHYNMLVNNQQLPFFIFNELILNENRLEALIENLSENHSEIYRNFDDELQEEIAKGNMRQITFLDLIITIVSLNVMLFMMSPIIKKVLFVSENEFKEFINHRKEENVRIILLSLKP